MYIEYIKRFVIYFKYIKGFLYTLDNMYVYNLCG